MTQPLNNDNTNVSGSRKFLAVLGILFVTAGIFLAAFGFSFKTMMLPKESKKSKTDLEAEVSRLELTVNQLEEENRRLTEENEILKGNRSSTTSSSSSRAVSSSEISAYSSNSSSSANSSSNSSDDQY